ncbi:MAG: UMP kinase [Immundisolibacteraceae bacterium]|nr:UMP kinase [Immundisolibacteraceae bacterium]
MAESGNKLIAKRVLLKLSGEALAGGTGFGVERAAIKQVVDEIAELVADGVEFGIVIGGGNIFRGISVAADGMDRATADYMGMLATVMNALALHDMLEREGVSARVMSALGIDGIAEPFVRKRALRHLSKGRVVIFAGGTGNPYFTTDTAACVRAIDINAEVLLKATKVDGVYNADPVREPDAVLYKQLGYQQVLTDRLAVMDATAIVMCRDHQLPLKIFNMTKVGVLKKVLYGSDDGTQVGDLKT